MVWAALRKPLLASTPMPPAVALRDVAFRLRTLGHLVDASRSPLKVKVDSLAALKVHVRSGPRGTEIRYEVDATNLGWTLVLILMFAWYAGIVAVVIAVIIHASAASFARKRLGPALAYPPLGALPAQDVRSFLIEGLSEAQRLSSEAFEWEREAKQNAIGLIVLGSIALWIAALLGLGSLLAPLGGDALVRSILIASALSAVAAVLGSVAVHVRSLPLLRELVAEKALYAAAVADEVLRPPAPTAQRGALELLLRAAERSPFWRRIRRRRRAWHDPMMGLTVFLLAYVAFFALLVAVVGGFLPLGWRALLAGIGVAFIALLAWSLRRWRRELERQDARDKADWEARRRELETTLWGILSG